ncbi:MAG: hypothetical protein JF606_25310 [Burkholderiales bacterium]|jgi:hypothetical protein|nr:hypothetical protein [Burkholderiales bacterium]
MAQPGGDRNRCAGIDVGGGLLPFGAHGVTSSLASRQSQRLVDRGFGDLVNLFIARVGVLLAGGSFDLVPSEHETSSSPAAQDTP